MDKDEIFNYVMETPQNTNPSVLRDMLNRLDTSDGLPEVDESDDGKVLTVSSGAWSAQNPAQNIFTYVFTLENEIQIQGLSVSSIELDYIFDVSRNLHTLPNTSPPCVSWFLNGFSSGNSDVYVVSIMPPVYDESVHEWSPFYIVLKNTSIDAKSVQPDVTMCVLGMELPLVENE